MNDLYRCTTPLVIRKWTDQTDGLCREPVRNLVILADWRASEPAPKPLALPQRRRLTWRETVAHLLRLHP